MFIIYGGNGWIGQKIVNILKNMKKEIYISETCVDDVFTIEKEIIEIKPTHIVCLIGRTHGTFENEYIPTIDFLEKKGKIKENVRDNLFCPIALAILCQKYNIHLTYMGTGCIFTYTDDKKLFSEEDTPNFFGSSYSIVKGYTDRLMKMFNNVLNVRIRMPISSDLSSRNFLMKMLKYEKICSVQNSMTVLDELLPIMCDMLIQKEIGTINLTNPGTIEHSEILDMMKEIIDPKISYELFSYEDQMKIISCERSNNELDTVKLLSKYKVKNIKDSVIETISNLKTNMNKLREIKIENYSLFVGEEFETPSHPVINELILTIKESSADILSPIIYSKQKLVFYGGIIQRNKVLIFDENFISLEDAKNFKNSFNYVKPSMIFYPRYFIIKNELLHNIDVNCIDLTKILNYSIKVTPFISVKMLVHINYKFKGLEKINIFNLEDLCVKEYLKINICCGITPLKIQNRKFLDNTLKHFLIIDSDLIRPDKDCGSIYILNMIKLLIKNNIQVHFLPLNFCFEEKYVRQLQKMGVYVNYNSFNDVDAYLSINCNVYDSIFVCRFDGINEIYDKIRNYCPQSKLVYVTIDLHSLRINRLCEIAKKDDFNTNLMNESLKLKELSYIKRSEYALITSTFEQDHLKSESINNSLLFPIFYDQIISKPRLSAATNGFYFIGSSHPPNVDAVNYFLKYIYHQIIKIQSIPFYIFGSCLKGVLSELLHPYGNLITTKDSISDEELLVLLSEMRINLIPLRFGAGVKGKLLQSLNNRIPTITTSIGLEGTVFQDKKHLLELNLSDPDYVSKFISYYNNTELLDKISFCGKEKFDECYSLEKVNNYMTDLLQKLELKKIIMKPKICVIFNTFDKPEIIKCLKYFLESIDGNVTFDYFLVNNGEKPLDETYDEFNPMIGDNTMNEFSGMQKCINMLISKNLISKYASFILCNDTISLHYPLSFIYTISKADIDIVCRNRYVIGNLDSFGKTYTLDNFKFINWYRAFFVMINAEIFKDMNYEFFYYQLEDVFFEDEKLKINIDIELKKELDKILSAERYKGRADLNKKYCCIFNEFRFSHEIKNAINK